MKQIPSLYLLLLKWVGPEGCVRRDEWDAKESAWVYRGKTLTLALSLQLNHNQ